MLSSQAGHRVAGRDSTLATEAALFFQETNNIRPLPPLKIEKKVQGSYFDLKYS